MGNFGSVILAILILGAVGAIGWLIVGEAQKWEQFKTDHHCKLVSRSSGQTMFGTNGTTYTSAGQNCYLCSDGVQYCR